MPVPRLAYLALFFAACGFGDNHSLGSTSTRHICGDAILDEGEGCDDGNTASGDGCSASCAVETPAPRCGNAIREVGEACDDGNVTPGDGCSATCQTETTTACTLLPQGGCATGEACDIEDDGDTACRAVTSQGNSNSHCATDTACRAGYTCTGDGDPAHDAWCARFCEDDADCTGTGSRCLYTLTSNSGAPLDAEICSNACDPYAQTGCPSQMGCVTRDRPAGDFTDCRYMGNTPDGQVCTSYADCRPGSDCVTANGVSRCEQYCIVGSNSTCPQFQTCSAFSPEVVIGSTHYGSCH